MTKAARTYRVIFWEEPIFEENAKVSVDLQPQGDNITIAVPKLPRGMGEADIRDTLRSLLDGVLSQAGAPRELIAWYGTPMMLEFSDHLRPSLTVYDNMDELASFLFAPPQLVELENRLLKRADVVFTGGMSIFEAKQHRHDNIHPKPSSIDKAHFAKARDWTGGAPEDQADIPHPRIGWFGVIDERMDPQFVADLADVKPDWQFVMIGPVVKIDPAVLPQRANIHWLGQKSYESLPAYLAGWDAGFIPYAINEATRFISPTKTPEFLAAGVPLVATPIKDIVRPYGDLGLCEIVDTPQQMADALERAMGQDEQSFLAKVDDFLADKSWDRTWSEMETEMKAASARNAEQSHLRESA
ncbi:MAG: glycosyltransferase [Hyphomicrobiales bacterium]|nr:glycosyltransferase [Hyphomicrobiales bacterium]